MRAQQKARREKERKRESDIEREREREREREKVKNDFQVKKILRNLQKVCLLNRNMNLLL